jgi:hypothetical protein
VIPWIVSLLRKEVKQKTLQTILNLQLFWFSPFRVNDYLLASLLFVISTGTLRGNVSETFLSATTTTNSTSE